jgi:hypothetical protein
MRWRIGDSDGSRDAGDAVHAREGMDGMEQSVGGLELSRRLDDAAEVERPAGAGHR